VATQMSVVDAKDGEVQGFSSVPALDFGLLDGQKGRFLAELRHILVNVGFLYLENPPIDKVRVIRKAPAFRSRCCQHTHDFPFRGSRRNSQRGFLATTMKMVPMEKSCIYPRFRLNSCGALGFSNP
jgi:hypothetical protein